MAHFVGLLLTAVFRFNKQGKACSEVTTQYVLPVTDMNDPDHSFDNDGYMLRCLFISQCCLVIPFCLCSCIGLMRGRTAGQTAQDRGIYAVDDDDNFKRTYA